MTSFKTPTQEQIEIAVQRMRSPEFAAYFFSRLDNPEWVSALKKEGLFASPPPPVSVEGGGFSFSYWPASKYLARMAKHVPSEVAAIFADLDTDNIWIISNMIEAALAMPANEGKTLVPAVCRAAQKGTLGLNFKDSSELCARLAEGGEVSAAMILAEALFTPKFEEGKEQLSQQDEYWYKDGLKKVTPALVEREPRRFLMKLCDWLKAAVQAKEHVDPDSGSDYSEWWRPAIEEHGQNRDYDFAAAMVGFVRQGFEKAIQIGKISLDDALEIIAPYSFLVFRRIRIHLIKEFAEQNHGLARQIIMDRRLFGDRKYRHEYAMLVGRRLDLLTQEERDTWFGWVDAGPDMSSWEERIKQEKGREATPEERQGRKNYWQFEKMHWVRKHLKGERKDFYEKMLAENGEPELADINFRSTGWFRGDQDSPIKVEELAKLTFEEAVEKVSSWKPEERGFMESDLEGLSSTFGQYVSKNTEAFSAQADALIGRPAIYVRGFIRQMSEAVKTGRDINVPAVLKLCLWVLNQPAGERTTPEQGHETLVDNDWQLTRDEISEFVQNLCKAVIDDTPKYPLEGLREQIWQLVRELYRDRAQSYIVHDISQDDPRVRDYLDLGINSPRGKAVEAALEYARWVANHLKKAHDKREMVPGGFEAMPEVRQMLEWQIAPDNRSFEALAVIGLNLATIYRIDKHWLASNAKELFRLESVEESALMAQGWAAWNAFLVWNRPYIEFYKLFKEQFAYAVAQSAHVNITERIHHQPMNSLGEHLMILYGLGHLGLDDDEGLLRRFLTESHPDIRRHAVRFVGRSIEGEEKIPEEILGRLMSLWEVYWTGAGPKDAEQKPDAWVFGTWFASGQFPEQWAIEQLEKFVEVAPTPGPGDAIVKQLAKIAKVDIPRTVRILDRMVHGDREGWRIYGWRDSAKRILEEAMRAGGDSRRQAEQVIDYLGRRGYTAFGELLSRRGI